MESNSFNLTDEQALRLEVFRLVIENSEYIQEEGKPSVVDQLLDDIGRILTYIYLGAVPMKGQAPC